jgi:hypothetical protein
MAAARYKFMSRHSPEDSVGIHNKSQSGQPRVEPDIFQ